MFAYFDPFSVSQCGLRSCGPNCRSKLASATISSCAARANPLAYTAKAASRITSHSILRYFTMESYAVKGICDVTHKSMPRRHSTNLQAPT
jgi:hypothetical protein